VLHFAISAILAWLAINVAFVVLRLRATRHPATLHSDRPSRPSPEVISVRHRGGRWAPIEPPACGGRSGPFTGQARSQANCTSSSGPL